jgi:N-methylhydantoinase B
MGCVGGGARACRFEPEPGTITCPDWGAAVSPAGVYATETAISTGNAVIAKMMLASSDESIRRRALSPDGGQWGCHFVAGINQRGDYYVGGMGDNMLGASGACFNRDGEFANGHYWIPEGRGPNVELYERDWPILYLYRREDPDSGGAGRWRGGNGGRLAYMPRNGEIAAALYTSEGIPKSPGILGGTPGNPGLTRFIPNSDVRKQFESGSLPGGVDELSGEEVECYGKGDVLELNDDSVLEYNWGGSAGYGDPLQRDTDRVFGDVAAGVVSAADAEHQYGVIVRDGRLDEQATEKRRMELRRSRLADSGAERAPAPMDAEPPADDLLIGEDLWVDRSANAYRCAHCGEELGSLSEHPKHNMVSRELPLAEIGERFHDPRTYVDDDIVWRELFCPGCATRLATEVCRPSDERLVDIRLSL